MSLDSNSPNQTRHEFGEQIALMAHEIALALGTPEYWGQYKDANGVPTNVYAYGYVDMFPIVNDRGEECPPLGIKVVSSSIGNVALVEAPGGELLLKWHEQRGLEVNATLQSNGIPFGWVERLKLIHHTQIAQVKNQYQSNLTARRLA